MSDYFFKRAISVKNDLPLFWKGVYSKQKEFAPNSFCSRPFFLEVVGMQEGKREVIKRVSLKKKQQKNKNKTKTKKKQQHKTNKQKQQK